MALIGEVRRVRRRQKKAVREITLAADADLPASPALARGAWYRRQARPAPLCATCVTRPMVAMPAAVVVPARSALIGVDRKVASSGSDRGCRFRF